MPDVTRDPRRSYEAITLDDLARLGRLGALELDEFFARNRQLSAWRSQYRFTALVQGGAEHYLRLARGIWDLDIAVFFAQHPGLPDRPHLRRGTRQWDWGQSKFGRCPLDHPEYQGRAVDVMLWVIPDTKEPLDGLAAWLDHRRTKKPDAQRTPDLAHEPVVLIGPDIGRVVWDPPNVPPPRHKTEGHIQRPEAQSRNVVFDDHGTDACRRAPSRPRIGSVNGSRLGSRREHP